MRILYLTFYFEPDLCAGSFRNTSLARELAQQAKDLDCLIKVITTHPNRYSSFRRMAEDEEVFENLIIRRIDVSNHKSGFFDQIFSFMHYYSGVLKEIKDDRFDLVFASSSRLFTGYLGFKVAKKSKIPLYLDIRDLFPDTMNDILNIPFIVKNPIISYLKYLEKKVFTYAQHVNFISGGFNSHIKKYNLVNVTNFSHGIDEEYIDIKSSETTDRDYFVITYAGNIGEGQGLHKIIPEAAEILGSKYIFKIIGDGGQIGELEYAIKEKNLNNVILEKPVSREKLFKIYSESDYLFVHLNNYEVFEKVLPSKLFELGAFDKPIIAGVSGYARTFIEEHFDNIILFTPGDVQEFVEKINAYQYFTVRRNDFISRFRRDNINREMSSSILSYLINQDQKTPQIHDRKESF